MTCSFNTTSLRMIYNRRVVKIPLFIKDIWLLIRQDESGFVAKQPLHLRGDPRYPRIRLQRAASPSFQKEERYEHSRCCSSHWQPVHRHKTTAIQDGTARSAQKSVSRRVTSARTNLTSPLPRISPSPTAPSSPIPNADWARNTKTVTAPRKTAFTAPARKNSKAWAE